MPDGKLYGRPMIQIAVSVGNNTDDYVFIGQCRASAYDREGDAIFQTEELGIYGRLAGPNTHAEDPEMGEGAWYSGPSVDTKRNNDITPADVKAVDRYETHCAAYRWVGAIPQPPGEGD
jgi:hypothetical protein